MQRIGDVLPTMDALAESDDGASAAQVLQPPDSMMTCPDASCPGAFMAHDLARGLLVPTVCPHFGQSSCSKPPSEIVQQRVSWAEGAGLPPRYQHPDATRIRNSDPILAYISDLLDNVASGQGVLLSGAVGVGKTMALAFIAVSAQGILQPHSVRFMFAPALFDLLHRDADAVERLSRLDLLLIDDFGREYRGSEWAATRFEALVEARYASYKATCASTNLSPAELAETHAAARVIDRWRQTCTAITIPGSSQR